MIMMTIMATVAVVLIAVLVFLFNQVTPPLSNRVKWIFNWCYALVLTTVAADARLLFS